MCNIISKGWTCQLILQQRHFPLSEKLFCLTWVLRFHQQTKIFLTVLFSSLSDSSWFSNSCFSSCNCCKSWRAYIVKQKKYFDWKYLKGPLSFNHLFIIFDKILNFQFLWLLSSHPAAGLLSSRHTHPRVDNH